jgi:predicted kinase
MLVVVCGVPGVGKTSVAEYAAARLDAELLRTDVVRKDLFADPEYTDGEARAVYEELLARAEEELGPDGTVVLDGTFHARPFREWALRTAERTGVDCRLLKVECEPSVARERIRDREGDESDADVRVHDMIREQFDPVAADNVAVDNSGALDDTRRQVRAVLDDAPTVTADGGS